MKQRWFLKTGRSMVSEESANIAADFEVLAEGDVPGACLPAVQPVVARITFSFPLLRQLSPSASPLFYLLVGQALHPKSVESMMFHSLSSLISSVEAVQIAKFAESIFFSISDKLSLNMHALLGLTILLVSSHLFTCIAFEHFSFPYSALVGTTSSVGRGSTLRFQGWFHFCNFSVQPILSSSLKPLRT